MVDNHHFDIFVYVLKYIYSIYTNIYTYICIHILGWHLVRILEWPFKKLKNSQISGNGLVKKYVNIAPCIESIFPFLK